MILAPGAPRLPGRIPMATPKPTFPPVDEQMELLARGAADLITEAELRRKLARSRETGKPLTVKVGFDPTAPDIHLGHTVLLRKMRHFQDLGHRVIFLIGDFTGMIGDPSGRSKTRPALSREEVLQNAETYKRQCYKILHPEKTEIRFNGEWLAKLTAEEVVGLAARYNVARMLERNDFKTRFQENRSIAIHEFLYPLAQAYDSVALQADVELGGTDQLFNLNVGRDVMPSYGLEPQVVLTTPLLVGLDGSEKMSKSLGNYVGIEEPPRAIYGKLLSISDELMWRYYELCTEVSRDGIESMKELVARGALHPKKAKEGLALRIVADFYDEAAARGAREEFERVHGGEGVPDEVPEKKFPVKDGKAFLPHVLHACGLAPSRTEATRLLRQGAVQIDGERLPAGTLELPVAPGDRRLFKVGKRRFVRVTFE
jgi:tyrosyl-tRNA synthetase